MGNFIDRIADRALGISPRVEPLVGSYFARSPAPDWLAVEPTVERTAPAPAGQRLPAAEGESSEPPGPDPPHLESTSPALTARTAMPPGDAERLPAPAPQAAVAPPTSVRPAQERVAEARQGVVESRQRGKRRGRPLDPEAPEPRRELVPDRPTANEMSVQPVQGQGPASSSTVARTLPARRSRSTPRDDQRPPLAPRVKEAASSPSSSAVGGERRGASVAPTQERWPVDERAVREAAPASLERRKHEPPLGAPSSRVRPGERAAAGPMQPRSHFREGDRADAADTILVEIGRVEVRAPQPPPAPVGTTEPDAGPQLSLAEYLRTRGLAK